MRCRKKTNLRVDGFFGCLEIWIGCLEVIEILASEDSRNGKPKNGLYSISIPLLPLRAAVAFQLVTWLNKLTITASRKKQQLMRFKVLP